jgi:hypothetical protein
MMVQLSQEIKKNIPLNIRSSWFFGGIPTFSGRITGNISALLGRQVPGAGGSTQLAELHRRAGRSLALIVFLARGNAHNLHRPADHVGRALLSARSFGHLNPFQGDGNQGTRRWRRRLPI